MIAGVAGPKAPMPKYGQPVAPNLNVRHLCPNCRNDPPNIIEEYSKGDLVCGDCGTILGDRIVDTRSEWRTFAGDEGGDDPSRVGDMFNPLLGNAFETTISSQDGRSGLARDLQRAQARVNNHGPGKTSTAALSAAFARINEMCETMQLTRNVVTRAQHVYKVADEKKVVRGKNEAAIMAACIIFACRDAGVARSYPEVCKATKVRKKELGRVFMAVKTAVQGELNVGPAKNAGQSNSEKSAEGLLARFTNWLDLGNVVYKAAKHVAVEANAKTDIDGRSPVSIAAGALYFTCVLFGKVTNAKDIARVAEVSDSTIKLICKMVAQKVDDVIRPEWKTEYPEGYATLSALGRVSDASARPSRATTPRPSAASTPQMTESNGAEANDERNKDKDNGGDKK